MLPQQTKESATDTMCPLSMANRVNKNTLVKEDLEPSALGLLAQCSKQLSYVTVKRSEL